MQEKKNDNDLEKNRNKRANKKTVYSMIFPSRNDLNHARNMKNKEDV